MLWLFLALAQQSLVLAQQRPGMSPQRHTVQQAPAPWVDDLVLPPQSPRIANYTMNVSLDTDRSLITGTEVLEWKNTTGIPQSVFPFIATVIDGACVHMFACRWFRQWHNSTLCWNSNLLQWI